MQLLKASSVYVSAHIENYHALPNLQALPPIPDNLDSPLLRDLSAAMSVYVLLFVWLRAKSPIGLLEALQ